MVKVNPIPRRVRKHKRREKHAARAARRQADLTRQAAQAAGLFWCQAGATTRGESS